MTDSFSGGIHSFLSRLSSIAGNIALLEPIVLDELMKMDDQTLWKSVCHNVIMDTLETVKEGTHLFQCPWGNREIFNDINAPHHYMIAKDPAMPQRMVELKPEIMVNIARLARFSMNCPFAGSEKCHLRNFRFSVEEEKKGRERI
jgi:hypothetical protein